MVVGEPHQPDAGLGDSSCPKEHGSAPRPADLLAWQPGLYVWACVCEFARGWLLWWEEVQVFGVRQNGGRKGAELHVGLAETDSGKCGRLGMVVGPRGVGKRWGGIFTTQPGKAGKVSQLHSLSIAPSIGPGPLIC